MKKNGIKLDEIKRKEPFKVPEGYFENFVTGIMSQLPERPVEQPKVISLWDRVKPFIYMAALFAGVALIANWFTKESASGRDIPAIYASQSLELSSSNDIDDFYHYYEDELTEIVYDDTVADFWGDVDAEYNCLDKK